MGRQDPRFLVVGHLNKPHGTKGELFAWPLTDRPESVYAPGALLLPGDVDGTQPDPDLAPLRLDSVRPFKRGYLVSFGGVRDREGAERLQGRYLFLETEALEPLAEGELFYHQLLGMEVVTKGGEAVGQIEEVYELRPADLLEVRGPNGTVMIPFLSHIVIDVDAEAGRMVIDPPEGLLDL
ncbi:MAG: ribosome maturation factor RimM [Gemmatimonadota bacterium]|nr:ribosome maturation factor RimM [Gemmatimonadota bacterium]